MGSGVSTRKKIEIPTKLSVETDDVDDQIDVDVLFGALFKLAPVFEIKEDLVNQLVNVVMDESYTCFDDQFHEVEAWIDKHGDAYLSPQEIYYLIKYVELYETPPPEAEGGGFVVDVEEGSRSGAMIDEPSVAAASEGGTVSLMCPFRSDFASWSAEIRSVELERTLSNEDQTLFRMGSLGDKDSWRSARRARTNSDMSDITV
jgi:hypothetical protein